MSNKRKLRPGYDMRRVRLAYARRKALRMVANGALRDGSGEVTHGAETLRQIRQVIASGVTATGRTRR